MSENDATKDFVQGAGRLVVLPESEMPKVLERLQAKMPWFRTYTPTVAVRVEVQRYYVSSFSRGWFPAKVIER